jgi:hypothetical protein
MKERHRQQDPTESAMWGKVSPTGDDGVGNVSNNFGTYYALTTDMTLEEYEKHVQ